MTKKESFKIKIPKESLEGNKFEREMMEKMKSEKNLKRLKFSLLKA